MPEMVISLGFVSPAVMGYMVLVKRFPILTAHPEPAPAYASAAER